ncbi:MAG: DUF5110 domain-containing protein [Fibrobacterales bacterium]
MKILKNIKLGAYIKNALYVSLIATTVFAADDTYKPKYGDEQSTDDIEMVEQGTINPVINLNDPHTEPMIPKWSLGFWQSYWGEDNGYGYQNSFIDHAEALRGLENQYGDHKHPADVMVLDMFWNDKEWGWDNDLKNMQWSYDRFPDPEKMIDSLHDMGFKIVLNYHSGGFGQEWLQKMREHLEWGVDVVWLDFWTGGSDYEAQVWELLREVWGDDKRRIFMARHYMRPNRMNYESPGDWGDMGELKAPNEDEIEKTMPMHWTGDNDGSWEGLQEAIDATVYSEDGSMGGWSYVHADCPGHLRGEDPELANRWIQHADFSPFTRNHGAGVDRDVWSWGEKVEENSHFSRMLRYRLLPYIYTYVWDIYDKAMPLTRPFKLAYPGQRDDIRYSYMFGEEFLVAPVYKKREDWADDKMPVWLPEGEEWVDYWTHTIFAGGSIVNYDVSESNDKYIPLFVKRGSIVPMGPEIYNIDHAVHPDPLTLDVYPKQSGDASFAMYDDDGESNGYTRNEYAQTVFTVSKEASDIEVTIGASKGNYSGKPTSRDYIVKLNLLDTNYIAVTHNDDTLRYIGDYTRLLAEGAGAGEWSIDGEHGVLYVRIETSVDAENSIICFAGDYGVVLESSSSVVVSSNDESKGESDMATESSDIVDNESSDGGLSSDEEAGEGEVLSSEDVALVQYPFFGKSLKDGMVVGVERERVTVPVGAHELVFYTLSGEVLSRHEVTDDVAEFGLPSYGQVLYYRFQ